MKTIMFLETRSQIAAETTRTGTAWALASRFWWIPGSD